MTLLELIVFQLYASEYLRSQTDISALLLNLYCWVMDASVSSHNWSASTHCSIHLAPLPIDLLNPFKYFKVFAFIITGVLLN